jgi:hypothetical protein
MPYIKKAPVQYDCDDTFYEANTKTPELQNLVKDEDVITVEDYGENTCFTPRQIIDESMNMANESLGLCTISDNQLLSLFRAIIAEMFAVNGEKEFNFMIKNVPIKCQSGVETYKLPRFFKSKIGLWYVKDNKKFELHYRKRTGWMNETDENIWTTESDNILLKLPNQKKRDNCCCCKECEYCEEIKSYTLMLEYYSYPPKIQSLDEPLCWLRENNDIWNFLIETMTEKLYQSQMKQYISSTKSFYRTQLLKWDQDLNPVDDKPKANRQSIKISKY